MLATSSTVPRRPSGANARRHLREDDFIAETFVRLRQWCFAGVQQERTERQDLGPSPGPEFDRRDREYRIIDSCPARLIAPGSYASNVFR